MFAKACNLWSCLILVILHSFALNPLGPFANKLILRLRKSAHNWYFILPILISHENLNVATEYNSVQQKMLLLFPKLISFARQMCVLRARLFHSNETAHILLSNEFSYHFFQFCWKWFTRLSSNALLFLSKSWIFNAKCYRNKPLTLSLFITLSAYLLLTWSDHAIFCQILQAQRAYFFHLVILREVDIRHCQFWLSQYPRAICMLLFVQWRSVFALHFNVILSSNFTTAFIYLCFIVHTLHLIRTAFFLLFDKTLGSTNYFYKVLE